MLALGAHAPEVPSLQDYYAAAMALFGIIIFAKFASRSKASSLRRKNLKQWAHGICVAAATVGAAVCFVVLGWGKMWGLTEEVLRWVVAMAAAVSGVILAAEVGFASHDPAAGEERNGSLR